MHSCQVVVVIKLPLHASYPNIIETRYQTTNDQCRGPLLFHCSQSCICSDYCTVCVTKPMDLYGCNIITFIGAKDVVIYVVNHIISAGEGRYQIRLSFAQPVSKLATNVSGE